LRHRLVVKRASWIEGGLVGMIVAVDTIKLLRKLLRHLLVGKLASFTALSTSATALKGMQNVYLSDRGDIVRLLTRVKMSLVVVMMITFLHLHRSNLW
jgi:hypothetical protein